MMTPFNLEAGAKVKFNTWERLPGLKFLQIVLTSLTPRSNGKGDIMHFNRIILFDIKHVISWPFCFAN